MPSKLVSVGLGLSVLIMGIGYGCGSVKNSSMSLGTPMISPSFKIAIPAGLSQPLMNGSLLKHPGLGSRGLNAIDIKTRFFSAGKTNLSSILQTLDSRIETAHALTGSCTTQTAIPYQISPFGQTVTLYAQCSQSQSPQFTGDPGILMFGTHENLTYLYSASGDQRVAAIIEPLDSLGAPTHSPGSSHDYQIEVWLGIGYGNPASTGSYGAVHLYVNSFTKAFEMALAGQDFGYCGAQLKSDGTQVYLVGSTDRGTTCAPPEAICVGASDLSAAATCGSELQAFELPALGRVSATGANGKTLGASQYPGGPSNSILLTGQSIDSLGFGPTTVPAEIGSL